MNCNNGNISSIISNISSNELGIISNTTSTSPPSPSAAIILHNQITSLNDNSHNFDFQQSTSHHIYQYSLAHHNLNQHIDSSCARHESDLNNVLNDSNSPNTSLILPPQSFQKYSNNLDHHFRSKLSNQQLLQIMNYNNTNPINNCENISKSKLLMNNNSSSPNHSSDSLASSSSPPSTVVTLTTPNHSI